MSGPMIPEPAGPVAIIPCDACALPTKVYRDGVQVALRVPRADYPRFLGRLESDPARFAPPAGTPIR